jgi:DUF1680 family protein
MKLLTLVVLVLMCGFAFAEPTKPFELSQVRLGDGIFKDSMEVNRKVLDAIGAERALYCFRFNASLDTKGAKPLGSWATPEPGGAFPGFFEGHYLSAISLMYAQTGDAELKKRVDYMVAELAKCQESLGDGFLFASPKDEFAPDRLDGVVWYRMHKLMEGLISAHHHAGNKQALTILNALAEWIGKTVDGYGDQFEKVKKVEYGGMTEAFINLFEITGNAKHSKLAISWQEKEKVLDKFHAGDDFTEHANTLLAKMVGAARTAEVMRSGYHKRATENFWDNVAGAGRKTYVTGGTSVHEGMPGMNRLADTQARMAQETCVSYNLLKVTSSLYNMTGEPKYMDYYERLLFNAILGSQDPATGWKTYYQPLNANTVKDFRSNERGCYCCNGTGMENPSKYGSMIYSHHDDAIRVNLFIASTVDWKEKGFGLEQITSFPEEATSQLIVRSQGESEMAVEIRVPGWCKDGFTVKVNGRKEKTEPGAKLVSIKRKWRDGDKIDVSMPMSFSTYAMPDKASQLAFMYGPLAMVGQGARPWLSELVGDMENANGFVKKPDAWFKPVEGESLKFAAVDTAGRKIIVKPYYQVGGKEFFTGYWDVVKSATIEDDGNIALGKRTIIANPSPAGVNVECFLRPAKTVDGHLGGKQSWYTKYFPNGMPPQWITIDLGADYDMTTVQWFPAKEDIDAKLAYRYKLEYSTDNKNWKVYADASNNDQPLKSYRHEVKAVGQYVRLTVLPRPKLEGNAARPKIAEIKVFGQLK